ncbi:MAG: hypothetical protein WB608_21920 [Terracidiphilus sp.]
MAISLHYSRRGQHVSSRRIGVSITKQTLLAAFGLAATLPAISQYPGQITKKDNAPELRAVGVLEWTGESGKPKLSRLVPVTVFDGQELQDGSVYLARPQPMAVEGGVEYVLQQDGKRIGLFDINNSGQEQGSWVGLGSWRPMPQPKIKAAPALAQTDVEDEGSDHPVLHRKHPSGDSKSGSSGSGSGAGTAPADPDRPTLHKKSSADDAGTSGTGTSGDSSASDPDRPTLHKSSTSEDTSSTQPEDPDRPRLKKTKEKPPAADTGYVSDVTGDTDPDRPRLLRGKPTSDGAPVAPTLMGLPPDMNQIVAVSDAQNRPEHPWGYSWANPDDQAKMQAQLEDIARSALGLIAPPHAPAAKTRTTRTKAKPVQPAPPPPLIDEQFRVFELAYGSGATLVLTAHTDGPLAQQKFVTLIAQPDLYGSLLILFKSVTDGSRLDETPRMRLVDAVDALADNRGELLFELRGETQRQFALYRVLRGRVEKLIVTGGAPFGPSSGE